EDHKSLRRFRTLFRAFLPPHLGVLEEAAVEFMGNESAGVLSSVLDVQRRLRDAWIKPTVIERELALLGVLYGYGRSKKETSLSYDHFVLTLLRATKVADRMRYCPTLDCDTPYFLARRRSQKYCSETCAAPAQRQFKKDWWTEHGSKWRKQAQRKKAQGKELSKKGAHK